MVSNTKEKIFDVAIDLFSKKGYDSVSIREIGRKVGIRESSIYNHYKNKEDILDSILDFFINELSEGELDPSEIEESLTMDIESFYHIGSEMFKSKVSNPKILKIWRIIIMEMFKNDKIKEFFQKEMLDGPLHVWELIFSVMIKKGLIRDIDPKVLAKEYFSYGIYMYIQLTLTYDEISQDILDLMFKEMEDHALFLFDNIKIEN